MLQKLLLAFALTFLLGFSQQSALLHEISHLADLDPVTQQQDQVPQHASHCDHCLGIGHLAHGLVSQHHFDFSPAPHQAPVIDGFEPQTGALAQHYAARAPPGLV